MYENSFGGGYPRKGDKEYLRKKIELTFYDPKHATDALVDECHAVVNDRNKLIRILYFAKSAIRHNLKDDLPGIQIPTCLIWGENDAITPPDVAEEFNSLIPNSGGAGKYRGGLGFQRRYHILADNVTFATYSDRFRLAPQGLFGGTRVAR